MQRAVPPASRRPDRGPKSITECGSFATLAKKAGELDALDRALRQTLPTPLREQVRFAHLRNGRLVFLATSPAWASRLRLMQAQILATARAIGACASSVTVKVAPPQAFKYCFPERKLIFRYTTSSTDLQKKLGVA